MRTLSLAVALPLFLLLTACRHAAQPASAEQQVNQRMQQNYATAITADAAQIALSPSALAALHQDKGVGLGLQINGRRFRVGQDIPLVLSYENISAKEQVSSTNCSGFAIALEDTDQGKDDLATINPCRTGGENNAALASGNLRFLHTSLLAVRLELTHPGRYLINAGWQSFRPRSGPFRNGDNYAVVRSNIIPIVVTP